MNGLPSTHAASESASPVRLRLALAAADLGSDGWPESDGHLAPVDSLNDSFDQLLSDYQNLQQKLATLPVIEQAKGLLIGRYGIDADNAFALLRRWSSHTNVKIRVLSAHLVQTASTHTAPGAVDHELDLGLLISRLTDHPTPDPAVPPPGLDQDGEAR